MSINITSLAPRATARVGHDLFMVVLLALTYYAGALVAFLIGTLSDNIFAPFWPPNAVLFCALLFVPTRKWWLCIAATFPAHALAEYQVGMHTPQMLVAFITNCMVAIVGAAALKYFVAGPPWFGSLRRGSTYVLMTTIMAPMIVALGGAFVPILGGGTIADFPTYWAQWFLANALGSLTLAPVAIIWICDHPATSFSRKMIIEALGLAIATIVTCLFIFEFGAASKSPAFLPALLYIPLPLALWAAIRFGVIGACTSIFLITAILISQALSGPSVFIASDPETTVFALQTFLLGLSITVFLLGNAIEGTRQAENALRASEDKMASAAVSAGVSLWSYCQKTNLFWITGHGRDMLGLAPDEPATRETIRRLIHPDDKQSSRDAVRAATMGELADFEFRIVHDDGAIRWIRCRARALAADEGSAGQVSGSFVDVTEQKAAEFELNQQRHELSHLMRVSMLGEMSGGIAHELTQPLSAILANAEAARLLLNQSTPDVTEIADALDDIIGEDNRAGEIIHRLRNLLKNREARFEAVDINEMISSTLKLLCNEMIQRRVKTTVELGRPLELVWGDSIQLQQVLLNLLLNAIEAVNEMTSLRRTIAIVSKVEDDGMISVTISDRGHGLSAHQHQNLFQPFFTTKEHGLGLGLSLSSTIVKMHGGVLTLTSNPEGGATATFRLPSMRTATAAK